MTPEAQRIAIAQSMGAVCRLATITGELLVCGPSGSDINARFWNSYKVRNQEESLSSHILPLFDRDLNAMHEAEGVLLNEQRRAYVELLIAVHPLHYDFRTSDDSRMAAYFLINATAAQRAEAFLRTLNLWKE
jgi:hypothetical protein